MLDDVSTFASPNLKNDYEIKTFNIILKGIGLWLLLNCPKYILF
jgi:hypothetical protein